MGLRDTIGCNIYLLVPLEGSASLMAMRAIRGLGSIGDRVNQPRSDDDPTSDDPEADFASAATEATILFAYVLALCVACAVLSWVPPFA